MATEIRDAILRANERKRAILGGDHGPVGLDSFVTLLSGFDLNPDEIAEMVEAATENGIRQMIETKVANIVVAAMFVDGLAAGLLIAEARGRAESPSTLGEELTMIALALKNQGIEEVSPERGVEILIERLVAA